MGWGRQPLQSQEWWSDALCKLVHAEFLTPFLCSEDHFHRLGEIEFACPKESEESGIVVTLGDKMAFVLQLLLELVKSVLLWY